MIVTVYFENGRHSEVVAHFSSDELYNACLPILEEEASKNGYVVTESMNEDEVMR